MHRCIMKNHGVALIRASLTMPGVIDPQFRVIERGFPLRRYVRRAEAIPFGMMLDHPDDVLNTPRARIFDIGLIVRRCNDEISTNANSVRVFLNGIHDGKIGRMIEPRWMAPESSEDRKVGRLNLATDYYSRGSRRLRRFFDRRRGWCGLQ